MTCPSFVFNASREEMRIQSGRSCNSIQKWMEHIHMDQVHKQYAHLSLCTLETKNIDG